MLALFTAGCAFAIVAFFGPQPGAQEMVREPGRMGIGIESGGEPATTVRIGSISNEPLHMLEKYQVLVDYLNDSHSQGDVRFEAVVAWDREDMIRMLDTGAIDIFIDSPFPVYDIGRLVDLTIFLRRWKNGEDEYYSSVFVRRDSGIETLEDLLGKRIAFEDRWSSGSYFLPKAALVENGIALVELESPHASVDDSVLGYLFTGDDATTLLWVLKRKVDAGAMNGLRLIDKAGVDHEALRVLVNTETIPRQVVSARVSLDASLIAWISDAFVSMGETPAGRTVLERFSGTTKFDRVPDESELRAFILEKIEQVESC